MASFEKSNQVVSGILDEGLPEEVAGIKTTDLIGYGAVAVTALLTFVIVKRSKRKRK